MPSWLTWTILALLSWGIWAFAYKVLGTALTPEQSQAISTLGILPLLVPLAHSNHTNLRTAPAKGLWLAFLGGAVTCVGNVAYYGLLAKGEKLASVVSLTALYPVTTILLAFLLLRERLNIVQVGGLALSLAAIWLFNVNSTDGILSPLVLFALIPIALWGLSGFLQKVATNHVSSETCALLYLLAFIPVGIFYALREPWPSTMTPRTWASVIALGFFLAFGNVAIVVAFARGGKASVIAPLGSLYPIVSVPLAVLLLGERPGAREITGIAIAIVSVAALSLEFPQSTKPNPTQ